MSWDIVQTRRFSRQYKKLHDNVAESVDEAVEQISQNPFSGEQKKGDLSLLRVLKFRACGQLYLLGYTVDEGIRLVYLESVSAHENFYRDLKRELK